MQKKLKIVVLTAATGGGHISAAGAIKEYIENSTEHEVLVIDSLKAVGKALDKIVCGSYLFMAKRAPSLFGWMYKKTNKTSGLASAVPWFNSYFANLLLPTIKEHNPDVIITVHPFVTEMISSLKEVGDITAPLICVMTDYGMHMAWLADYVDAYIVANDDMVSELKSAGVDEDKICPYGIPVKQVFFEDFDNSEFIKSLDFDESIPTVLLMAGSFGVSSVMTFYRKLLKTTEKMQFVIITGHNEKLHKAFENELATNPDAKKIKTKLLMFTTEVYKYMKSADLIITKPGGLTTSEALACNLPLLVFDAIPGQEEDNAAFLERHNMGIKIGSNDNVAELISSVLGDRDKLNSMVESCKKFDKSQAMPQIVKLAEELFEESPDEDTYLERQVETEPAQADISE